MSEIPDLKEIREYGWQHRGLDDSRALALLAYVAQLQECLREARERVDDLDGRWPNYEDRIYPWLDRIDALLPVSLDEANQQGPG